MKTVWKYKLYPTETQILQVPDGSIPLSVAEQYDEVVLYLLVDTSTQKVPCRVDMVGTGHDISTLEPGAFVGTVKLMGGMLIFHIWVAVNWRAEEAS